jgi:DNA-binding PadR family transcriptional regulator
MPEVRDKRRKIDLDLFVLALVNSGVVTPYALQMSAGLSPGASIPALQRLTEAGHVRQGKPGSRGRTEHRITVAGKKLLKTGWKSLIEDGPSGDLDADLRVALLTLASGERRLAKDFLDRSAARKLESISALERPDKSDSLPPLAFWYRELRSASAKAMLKGGSAAALAMAEALPRTLTRSNRRTRRTITR